MGDFEPRQPAAAVVQEFVFRGCCFSLFRYHAGPRHFPQSLIKMGKPLTVKNWVSLNYWDRTLEDLEGEELAAVPFDMLVDTDSDEFVN